MDNKAPLFWGTNEVFYNSDTILSQIIRVASVGENPSCQRNTSVKFTFRTNINGHAEEAYMIKI